MNTSKQVLLFFISFGLTAGTTLQGQPLSQNDVDSSALKNISIIFDKEAQLLFFPSLTISEENKTDIEEFRAVLDLPYKTLIEGENRLYFYNEALRRYISSDRNTEILEQFKAFKANKEEIAKHYLDLYNRMQQASDLN